MEEKDIKDKLFNLIISIFNDKSSLEKIIIKTKKLFR